MKRPSPLGTVLILSAGGLAVYRWLRWRRGIDFAGQIAVIVGGSRGLGLAIARELATEGAHLVLVGRNVWELERAQADISNRGGVASIYICDIGSRADIERTVACIAEDYGGIDVLINDGGTVQVVPFTIIAALPHLAKSPARRIVDISSIGERSEALHAELASQGIRVTTVSPCLTSAGPAPRQIVDACRYGDPVPTTGLPARVMAFRNRLSDRATIENDDVRDFTAGHPAW